eukprot:3576202-Lingulodinium_polyedra.AAC.1
MRDEHVPLQRVVEAVAGCRKAFVGRRRFVVAAQVLQGWRADVPVKHAPPVPEEAVYAAFTVLVGMRRREEAVGILLCFCAILR